MRARDKLAAHIMRGIGTRAVYVQFPGSNMAAHLSEQRRAVPETGPLGAPSPTAFVDTPQRTLFPDVLVPTDSGRIPASGITISSSWPASDFKAA